MTVPLNDISANVRSEGRKLVVEQHSAKSDDLESDYQFFRTLVKNNIFQLTNVSGNIRDVRKVEKRSLD